MNVLDIIKAAEETPLAPLPPEIEGYADEENPEVRGRWQIENLPSFDWALARLAECEAEAAEIDRQERAAIERVKARAAELRAKAERGAGFFRFKLLEGAERHRTLLLGTAKKKSREFIHGRIAWRSKPERLVVEDAKALEAWLWEQPVERGLYRTKIEPEMAALQYLAKHGEIPPGCKVSIEPETIKIEATAPEGAIERKP